MSSPRKPIPFLEEFGREDIKGPTAREAGAKWLDSAGYLIVDISSRCYQIYGVIIRMLVRGYIDKFLILLVIDSARRESEVSRSIFALLPDNWLLEL
ncbi:hypothetical protein CEXT_125031 [Caerostris extrusa]|uniref:Uncharacterized protein n=1 Tax=Caerostris extrusa TaxID=172846 RepID=A0AAV4Y7K4_CAEEX|nr:hypothetical protein CEXT_125031 [Caerostris extrusa]